jgi:hypothetical protein
MNDNVTLKEDAIINRIYLIRGMKVMLDRDLADMYGVETRRLNEQVRRNLQRFPCDFMFQMTSIELENWMSQNAISNREKKGLRKPPLCFTEQGIAMLSSVLNSETAISVNIQIIRIFTEMRKTIINNQDILLKMNFLENKINEHDNINAQYKEDIDLIFKTLRQIIQPDPEPRKRIGFRPD